MIEKEKDFKYLEKTILKVANIHPIICKRSNFLFDNIYIIKIKRKLKYKFQLPIENNFRFIISVNLYKLANVTTINPLINVLECGKE